MFPCEKGMKSHPTDTVNWHMPLFPRSVHVCSAVQIWDDKMWVEKHSFLWLTNYYPDKYRKSVRNRVKMSTCVLLVVMIGWGTENRQLYLEKQSWQSCVWFIDNARFQMCSELCFSNLSLESSYTNRSRHLCRFHYKQNQTFLKRVLKLLQFSLLFLPLLFS